MLWKIKGSLETFMGRAYFLKISKLRARLYSYFTKNVVTFQTFLKQCKTPKGTSRTPMISSMEFYGKLVNPWKPLTNVIKISIFDVVGVLDMPLIPFYQNTSQWLLAYFSSILLININDIFWTKLLLLKSVYLFLTPFSTNVTLMSKQGRWLLPAKCL